MIETLQSKQRFEKSTGRKLSINPAWHGAPYQLEDPDLTPLPPRPKDLRPRFDRTKYQREYMRRRREKAKQ